MAEIKESVRNLMYKSEEETSKKLDLDFVKHLENNLDLELDIRTYENSIDILRNLESKYSPDRYGNSYNKSELRRIMRREYRAQFRDVELKIRSQFNSISERLSKMRNPNTALDFLKACGIELPEKVKPVIQIDVDPEFIKSILPKQNLLTDGTQEAANG